MSSLLLCVIKTRAPKMSLPTLLVMPWPVLMLKKFRELERDDVIHQHLDKDMGKAFVTSFYYFWVEQQDITMLGNWFHSEALSKFSWVTRDNDWKLLIFDIQIARDSTESSSYRSLVQNAIPSHPHSVETHSHDLSSLKEEWSYMSGTSKTATLVQHCLWYSKPFFWSEPNSLLVQVAECPTRERFHLQFVTPENTYLIKI